MENANKPQYALTSVPLRSAPRIKSVPDRRRVTSDVSVSVNQSLAANFTDAVFFRGHTVLQGAPFHSVLKVAAYLKHANAEAGVCATW